MRDAATARDRDDVTTTHGSRLGPRASLLVTGALVVGLVAAVWGGVVLSRYHAQSDPVVPAAATSGGSELDRTRVQEAVSVFAANLNTYSVRDIDDYRSRILPLLTDSFGQSFDLAVDNTIAMVKATRMTSEGEVLATGVSAIDARRATALVVADAKVTSDLGDRLRHFRWKVTLVKQDGRWLVDGFTPVA